MRHLTNLDGDAAFQNVEAFFERVQVQLNGAVGIKEADARAHVDRSQGAIHVRRAPETGAVVLIERGSLRGGWVDLGDSVHGESIYYGSCIYATAGRPDGASRKLTFVNRIVTRSAGESACLRMAARMLCCVRATLKLDAAGPSLHLSLIHI